MKKTIIVLLFLMSLLSILAAVTNTSNVVLNKPMSERVLLPSSTIPPTSSNNPPTRQTFLTEDFTGLAALPTGWSVDAQAAHWIINASNSAGGESPELVFDWSPTFNGISHLISPVIDLTGQTSVNLEFMNMIDHYATPYTLGIATRSNNGTWNTVWSTAPSESTEPSLQEITISNADVGSATFQFCFFFSGSSYNINDWYIDNIRLYVPWQHDVKVKEINTNITYVAGSSLTPPVVIANVGTASASFNVNCKIYENESLVYNQTLDMVIPHGAVANAEFPAFIPMDPNELYRIVVTTNLEGDQDTTNDTMIKYFNTYATDRQKVMVEIGTGTWCQYCPGAALGADDLVSNGKQVAVVEYHNGDTFTNDASNARNTYYSVPGFPTAYFDGTTKFVGGNHTTSTYQWYLPIYEAAFPIMSPFYISMTGSLEGTTLTTNVDVKRFARISDSPLVLHFAVTESNIAFSWQGQSELDFVERAMTPDYNGTTLAIQDVESQSIELTTTLNTAWNQPELELVAFIQDPATKVIYQGFVISLPDLLPQYQASAPISLQATQDGAVVHLAWTQPTDNAGLSGYLIYRDGVLIHTITHPTSSTYDDVAVDGNRSYYVKALYGPAISGQSNTFTLEVSASDPVATPVLSSLTGNYPNPFLSSTSIRYEMKNDAKVSLAIYNIKGQLVRVLENGMKTTGSHNVVWDGTDKNGNKLASGVYIVQFNTGNVKQSQKVIMMK